MERHSSGKLQAVSYKLQAASYKLQAASYKLQATSYKLQGERATLSEATGEREDRGQRTEDSEDALR